MSADKCPKCGSEILFINEAKGHNCLVWRCGTEQRGERLFESPPCIERQRDQLKAMVDTLKSATQSLLNLIEHENEFHLLYRKEIEQAKKALEESE